MQLILFARDDSSNPNYLTGLLWKFDVVDILPDNTYLGNDVNSSLFYVVDCDCTLDDIIHLKDVLYVLPAIEPEVLRQRKYSLDGLPAPYFEQLISTGRGSIPLGVILASQRVKS